MDLQYPFMTFSLLNTRGSVCAISPKSLENISQSPSNPDMEPEWTTMVGIDGNNAFEEDPPQWAKIMLVDSQLPSGPDVPLKLMSVDIHRRWEENEINAINVNKVRSHYSNESSGLMLSL